jgi:hypothetical protein
MPTGCAPFELGVVEDGQPQRNWHVISEHCRLLYSEPGGRLLGFDSRSVSELDLDALEAEGLFEGPRFDVPVLGLRDATIGEICLAARGYLGDEPTLDVAYFRAAVSAGSRGDLDEAEQAWRVCLEAGAMERTMGSATRCLNSNGPTRGTDTCASTPISPPPTPGPGATAGGRPKGSARTPRRATATSAPSSSIPPARRRPTPPNGSTRCARPERCIAASSSARPPPTLIATLALG